MDVPDLIDVLSCCTKNVQGSTIIIAVSAAVANARAICAYGSSGSYAHIGLAADHDCIIICPASLCPGFSSELISMLAQPNPILYFNTIELLCRTRSWDTWSTSAVMAITGIYVLLHPPFSAPEELIQLLQRLGLQQVTVQELKQQQEEGWRLYKAALSAYASWAKAYTKLLKAYAQSPRYSPESAEAASADPYWVLFKLLKAESFLLPWVASSSSPACAASDQLQLLLLLWRARVVAATVEHLGLRPAAAAVAGRGGGRTSSMTGGSSGSSSTGESGGASASLVQMGCGSSSSSSGSKYSSSRSVLGRSSDSVSGELHVVRSGAVNLSPRLCIVRSHFNAVQLWHIATSAEPCTAGAAAEAAVPGSAADAFGLSGDADSKLSQRLLRMPCCLPPSVVKLLKRISTAYPEEVLAGQQQAEGDSNSQQQVQLLQDMLGVSELLLAEVPCTLGCSNPGCVDLSGSSEVKVSSLACSACKVVCYCSKECQVAHRRVHKGLCKKLQAGLLGCAGKEH